MGIIGGNNNSGNDGKVTANPKNFAEGFGRLQKELGKSFGNSLMGITKEQAQQQQFEKKVGEQVKKELQSSSQSPSRADNAVVARREDLAARPNSFSRCIFRKSGIDLKQAPDGSFIWSPI